MNKAEPELSEAGLVWPPGGGEVGALLRSGAWTATPLGPVERWPPRFRTLVELVLASPVASFLVCGPDRLLLYNDAAAWLHGGSLPAALGRPAAEVWPEVWWQVAPICERVFAGEAVMMTGQPWKLRRHGERGNRFYDACFTPVRGDDGAIAWAHVVGVEVTGRVRESEERFRLMLENWAQAAWEADAGGIILSDSPSWRAYTGQSEEEWLSQGWLSAVHPDDRAFAERRWRSAIATKRPDDAEFRLRRVGGGWRWTNVRVAPLLHRDGTVAKWVGINIDVTARKEAEQALKESEARLRSIVEGIPHLVFRARSSGERLWVSPQWIAYTGLSLEECLGQGWLSAIHPDDRAATMAAWAEAEVLCVVSAEYRMRRATDGAYRWFESRAAPVRDARGRIVEWFGTSTDIDDQMRAREVLARDRKELEALVAERTAELMATEAILRQAQKMEAVGQLTGGIAHDFNNMLQGVTGSLEMMIRRIEQGRVGEVAHYIDAARDATGRAAGLTRRLLAFARRQRLDQRPVDANTLIAGMADLIRRTVGPGVEVELKLRDGTGTVLCDPNELENALLNLCINARDAMPHGGRLTIGTEDTVLSAQDVAGEEISPGAHVVVSVADTGEGMTPDILDRAFEPFFTTKPQGQGTGLGLSQVYGFVRQSGGLVRLESATGQGTAVRLFLPRQAALVATVEPATAPVLEQAVAVMTVLLVDDEEVVREPAAERLRELGYRVLEASDGPTALRALADAARIDLLVTDVGLPHGMNGRQVAEAVRERVPGVPVLFVTGYAHTTLPPGFQVISKPFELDALARRVQEQLQAGFDGSGEDGGPHPPKSANS